MDAAAKREEASIARALQKALCKVAKSDVCISTLVNDECHSLFTRCVKKALTLLKKRGLIELFVFSDEFKDKGKLETAYLLNKHPELSDLVPSGEHFVIIKF